MRVGGCSRIVVTTLFAVEFVHLQWPRLGAGKGLLSCWGAWGGVEMQSPGLSGVGTHVFSYPCQRL